MRVILGILVLISVGASAKNWLEKYKEQEPLLKKIAVEQIEKISNKANNTNSKNEKNLKGFVLSTEIASFSDIPNSIDLDIKTSKKEIAGLIRMVATDIELNQKQYAGVLTLQEDGSVSYKPSKNLPDKLNEKRKKLIESNMVNGVTVKSATIALKLLSNINNGIIEKAKKAKDRETKSKLYMKQAIYVYEMSDIVLNLLNSLTLEGVATLKDLHKDAINKMNERKNIVIRQKNDIKRLHEEGLVSDESLKRELDSLDLIEKASEKSLDAWKDVFVQIGNQEEFMKNIKKKLKLVRYKKNKAKLQIETLRDIRSVATLKSMIGSIDDLVDNIDQLDLLVLDEHTVAQLLGTYEE